MAVQGLDFPFGLSPLATQSEQGSVLNTACGEESGELPATANLAYSLAPLRGAVIVVYLFAGADQVAAGGADHARVGDLSRSSGRSGLIELTHAGGDFASGYHREPLQCDPQHLHVRRSHGASEGSGLLAQAPCG